MLVLQNSHLEDAAMCGVLKAMWLLALMFFLVEY